jgi:hypothetical protein
MAFSCTNRIPGCSSFMWIVRWLPNDFALTLVHLY